MMGPNVSTAIGTKPCFTWRAGYFRPVSPIRKHRRYQMSVQDDAYMDTGGVPGVEFAGDHEIMVSPSEDLQSLRSRPGGSLVLGCPMSGGIRYNVINWKVSAGSSTDCLHFAESILIRHLATLALMWRSVT